MSIPPNIALVLGILLALAGIAAAYWVYVKWPKTPPAQQAYEVKGQRERRRRYSNLLHLGVLLLVLLAFFDFSAWQLRQESGASEATPAVVMLLDASESMADEETQEWCRDQIRNYHAQVKDKAYVAGIVFGGQSEVLFSANESPSFSFKAEDVAPGATNYQQALKMAGASVLTSGPSKVLLFTDGRQTMGDGLREAYLLQDQGVEVYPVIPPGFDRTSVDSPQDSTSYNRLRMPRFVHVGEVFPIEFALPPEMGNARNLRTVWKVDGQALQDHRLGSGEGKTWFAHQIRINTSGMHLVEVEVTADQADPLTFSGFINCMNRPQVLLLETENSGLAEDLKGRQMDIESRIGETFYCSLEELEKYQAIWLNDVKLSSLERDMEFNLVDYVQEKRWKPGV